MTQVMVCTEMSRSPRLICCVTIALQGCCQSIVSYLVVWDAGDGVHRNVRVTTSNMLRYNCVTGKLSEYRELLL